MAKKLSKFGAAFKAAKDGSTFSFGGKSYKKEYASANSGPKTGAPMPKSRPDMEGMNKAKKMSMMAVGVGGKRAIRPLQDRGNSGVAEKYGSSASIPSRGGPSKRGGGPKIAMSAANIAKRKSASTKGDNSFSGNLKNAAKGFKKFVGY